MLFLLFSNTFLGGAFEKDKNMFTLVLKVYESKPPIFTFGFFFSGWTHQLSSVQNPVVLAVHKGLYYPANNKDPHEPISLMECQPRVLNLAQVMSFQHIPERTLNESSFDTLDGSEILRSPSGMLKNSMNNGDKLPIYTSTGEFTGFLVAIVPVVSSILLDHFVGEIHSQSLPFSNFDLQDKCVKSVGFEPTGRNGVFLFEKNGGRLTQKLFENSCDLLEVTKAVFKKDIVDVCISIHCKKHVDYDYAFFFFRVSCLSIRHILLIHIILCYTNKQIRFLDCTL